MSERSPERGATSGVAYDASEDSATSRAPGALQVGHALRGHRQRQSEERDDGKGTCSHGRKVGRRWSLVLAALVARFVGGVSL